MKKQGATLVDAVDIETFGKSDDTEFTGFLYERKADLNAYLARLGPNAPVKSLKEVVDFNERNREKEMPYFGQDIFLKAEEKGPPTTKEYLDLVEAKHRLAGKEGIDTIMDKNKLDALVGPTGGPAWLTDLRTPSRRKLQRCGRCRLSHINVPADFVFDLPVEISFFGRAWSEPVLIRLAYAFEQATKHRKAPRFLPSADLRG